MWEARLAALARHLAPPGEEAGAALARAPAAAGDTAAASAAAHGIAVSAEVAAALAAGRPVVALESTIVAHGMPWPENLETALAVEAVVRAHGATPATVAVLAGVPHVGLSRAQLERVARGGAAVRKASRRDLPLVCGLGRDGATTVSATALLAARAGVAVFVTGGVGGVHRGGERSWDVSADLFELGRTPVAVVCAGAKSVLDIPRTLEVLESQGVAVAAYGTDEFPAFFSPRSGVRAPARVDSPAEAAALVAASRRLRLGGGVLLAVPVPVAAAAAGAEVEAAIGAALAEADAAGVAGAEVTPFLLRRVRELTGGASLAINIALVKNNAAIGAAVAVALSELERREAGAKS
jgi:pseudouridine-5'-phosphate glycosidase